jgi:hypothetical protein
VAKSKLNKLFYGDNLEVLRDRSYFHRTDDP